MCEILRDRRSLPCLTPLHNGLGRREDGSTMEIVCNTLFISVVFICFFSFFFILVFIFIIIDLFHCFCFFFYFIATFFIIFLKYNYAFLYLSFKIQNNFTKEQSSKKSNKKHSSVNNKQNVYKKPITETKTPEIVCEKGLGKENNSETSQ